MEEIEGMTFYSSTSLCSRRCEVEPSQCMAMVTSGAVGHSFAFRVFVRPKRGAS